MQFKGKTIQSDHKMSAHAFHSSEHEGTPNRNSEHEVDGGFCFVFMYECQSDGFKKIDMINKIDV